MEKCIVENVCTRTGKENKNKKFNEEAHEKLNVN